MMIIDGIRKLVAQFHHDEQDDSAPRKCPCCARAMSYFPHMPSVGNGAATARVAAWGCIYCGR